jgi:hypothetical protein
MRHYLITLISGTQRIERNVIAGSANQAYKIAANTLAGIAEPCCIICKLKNGVVA